MRFTITEEWEISNSVIRDQVKIKPKGRAYTCKCVEGGSYICCHSHGFVTVLRSPLTYYTFVEAC